MRFQAKLNGAIRVFGIKKYATSAYLCMTISYVKFVIIYIFSIFYSN